MKLRNQLFLGYAVVFILMLAIAGVMYVSTSWLIESQAGLERTYRNVASADRLQDIARNMQSAKRGFLIGGYESLLQPFEEARAAFRSEMAKLQKSASSNSALLQNLEEIDTLINDWIENIALKQIAARRKIDDPETLAKTLPSWINENDSSKTLFQKLNRKIDGYIGIQKSLRRQRRQENNALAQRSILTVLLGTLLAIGLGSGLMVFTTRSVLRQVGGEPAAIAGIAEEIGKGNLDMRFEDESESDTGIKAAIGIMLQSLRDNRTQAQTRDWVKTGNTRLNEILRGDPEVSELATKVISEISAYLEAQVGALYMAGEGSTLSLVGSYAYKKRKNLSNTFALGEGIVGQAALEKQQILLKNVPEDYIKVTSGIGERVPSFICVTPFLYEDRVKGVVEIGTLNEMTDVQLEYLEQAMPTLAVAVETAEGRTKLVQALSESQKLSEELQVQQEELRTTNEGCRSTPAG